MRGVPRRTCLGCRRARPKVELIRLVRGVDGTVIVDALARAAGRGAYACPTIECLERVLVTGCLARAFRGAVQLPRESAAEIAEYWRRR